jgi:hypothetical protein
MVVPRKCLSSSAGPNCSTAALLLALYPTVPRSNLSLHQQCKLLIKHRGIRKITHVSNIPRLTKLKHDLLHTHVGSVLVDYCREGSSVEMFLANHLRPRRVLQRTKCPRLSNNSLGHANVLKLPSPIFYLHTIISKMTRGL